MHTHQASAQLLTGSCFTHAREHSAVLSLCSAPELDGWVSLLLSGILVMVLVHLEQGWGVRVLVYDVLWTSVTTVHGLTREQVHNRLWYNSGRHWWRLGMLQCVNRSLYYCLSISVGIKSTFTVHKMSSTLNSTQQTAVVGVTTTATSCAGPTCWDKLDGPGVLTCDCGDGCCYCSLKCKQERSTLPLSSRNPYNGYGQRCLGCGCKSSKVES